MGPEQILVDVGYDYRFVLLVDRRRLHRYVLSRYQNTDGLAQDVLVITLAYIIVTVIIFIPKSFAT